MSITCPYQRCWPRFSPIAWLVTLHAALSRLCQDDPVWLVPPADVPQVCHALLWPPLAVGWQ